MASLLLGVVIRVAAGTQTAAGGQQQSDDTGKRIGGEPFHCEHCAKPSRIETIGV